MKNGYCRLSHLRYDLNAEGVTSNDSEMLAARDAASRMVENLTGRRFYSEIATAEYDGNGKGRLWLGQRAAQPYRGDLLTVTTLKVDDNGDGTFERTLVENTDYWLHPDGAGAFPAEALDIVTGRTTAPQIYAWPNVRRCVEIVGKFGYSEITELSGTLGAAISTTNGTSATMAAGYSVEVGDVIIIDSEQIYVSAVSTNTLTIERGINGSTAATHLISTAVYVRRYPEDIERAVRADARRWLTRAAAGDYAERGIAWRAIEATLEIYGKGGVGAGLAVG